jgi:dihydroxyacetone kinase-like protein
MRALDAPAVAAWLAAFADEVDVHEAWLTDLDRRIGDADHGTNMRRGVAAVRALPAEGTAAEYVGRVAMALISTVGGAAGPLYGTFFLRLGRALPADGPITGEAWAAALGAGVRGVADRGRAVRGDKTMLDALLPALDAFEAAGDDGPWAAAAAAAASGRDSTTDLVARKGRASYLGERSRGTTDPGAASATLLVEAAARTLS